MFTKKSKGPSLSRRQLLTAGAAGAVVVAGAGSFGGTAKADVPATDALMKELIGDVTPAEGNVTIKAPEIAENGNTVPVEVSSDLPMTEGSYVKAIHVFAEGNPTPGVASFMFTPMSGQAFAKFRMRMAKTQDIRAVAVTSDGKAFMGKQQVKVTIGGCGG